MEWYEWLNPFKATQAVINGFTRGEFDTTSGINGRIAQKAQEEQQKNLNITKGFEDLISGGSNSTQLMNYALENADWARENGDFINPFIQSQMNRDNLSKDLSAQISAFKENGINPLNITGNLGSLGTSQVDIAPAQQSNENDNNQLADMKNMLSIAFLIAKIAGV